MLDRWTDDKTMNQYSFCNVFRVTDRVSQYIVTDVIEKGDQKPTEVVFRVILFNTFTRISTWEALNKALGPLTWKTYNRQKYAQVLRKQLSREALYTGAFQKPGPARLGHTEMFMNHLELLEIMMQEGIVEKLQKAKSFVEAFEHICRYQSMSDFTGYQLLVNLSYSSVLKQSTMDFVIPGLGCSSGLIKLFGQDFKNLKQRNHGLEVKVIHWMTDNQKQEFKKFGLKFAGLGPDQLPMDVTDVEHAICEVDKYCRKVHPSLKGNSSRTELRNTFRPSATVYPKEHAIPKAWAARKRNASSRQTRPQIEKAYVVEALKDRRRGSDGIQYSVKWTGYADCTWEPVEMLQEDIPDILAEYNKKHGIMEDDPAEE
jgi:hypothetical protein